MTAVVERGMIVDSTGVIYTGSRWSPVDETRPSRLLSYGGRATLSIVDGGQPVLLVDGKHHPAQDSLEDRTTAVTTLGALVVAVSPTGVSQTPLLPE